MAESCARAAVSAIASPYRVGASFASDDAGAAGSRRGLQATAGRSMRSTGSQDTGPSGTVAQGAGIMITSMREEDLAGIKAIVRERRVLEAARFGDSE